MASISNFEGDPSAAERKRKRTTPPPPASAVWKTEAERSRYSTKLLAALRRVRPSPSSPPRSRLVREAADRALAAAARGRTRWSRAVLAGRPIKLKAAARRRRPAVRARSGRPGGAGAAVGRRTPVLERKAKLLGRLVPGGRKLSFPTLLEEASDYIAALQMQVRAMSALAQILAGDRTGPSGSN